MLASLWSWIAPTPRSSQAQQDGGPSPRLVAQLDNDDQQLPASTKRNRKKRRQHKKKKQQARLEAQTEDDDDEREPDELLWHDEERRRSLDHYPDADQDETYLLLAVEDENPSAETTAGAGTATAAGDEASSTRMPQRPTTTPRPTPGGAPPVPPESLAVDDLVASMLAQGKTHPGPTGPLQRVHNLPDGAGQAPGLPLVRSTADSRRKAVEHGLVPITDEHGTLRVGFRIREDIVLMHPKDLKGEPVLLRM